MAFRGPPCTSLKCNVDTRHAAHRESCEGCAGPLPLRNRRFCMLPACREIAKKTFREERNKKRRDASQIRRQERHERKKERDRKKAHAWYERNKERKRQYMKSWRANNPKYMQGWRSARKVTLDVRICENERCGMTYTPKTKRSHYCSPVCEHRQNARNQKLKKHIERAQVAFKKETE